MRSFNFRTALAGAGIAASLLAMQPAIAAETSLYQQFGEKEGVVRLANDATDRWLADERIKDTFDNINLDRFKRHLADQICELVGGPCKYTGRNMYESHKGLHLNSAEFNALAEDLQYVMEDLKIPFGAQMKLMKLLAPMERDVVTRSRFE